MEKVISINLRGNAYQLEDKGYKLLNEYLMQARNSLADDPDKDEVMQDFEQAIAEKCDQLLREHKKTVVVTKEVQDIIAAMGPVEADIEGDTKAEPSTTTPPIKKLYTLKDGALIGGVCTGLGAYFNVDVVVIRLAFVILSLFTFGFSLLLYLCLMLLVPEAKTPEQKAELRGQKFNAQAVLDRAKQKYAEVSQYPAWKGQVNPPALSNLGNGIMTILRGLSMFTSIFLGTFAVGITVLAFAFIWSIGFGSLVVAEEFRDLSLWTINLALACAYVIVIVPTMALSYVSYMFARKKPVSRKSNVLGTISWVIWSVALTAAVCISIAHIDKIRDYDRRLESQSTQMMIQRDVEIDQPNARQQNQ